MATDFTEDQLSAAEFRNLDVCVVAGPGSGKTTVLVERYRSLVEERDFDQRHILAITFTEKAAANMRSKLAERFRDKPDRLRDLESASWVSTIHGFCMRLLRENAIAAGLDPRFTVLSAREAETLQWECMQSALDEITAQRRAETLELIEALHSPGLAGDLKDAYDAMRSAGLSIGEVRAMPNPGTPLVGSISERMRAIIAAWPFKLTSTQLEEKARLLEWCTEYEDSGETDLDGFLRLMDRLKINLQRVPGPVKTTMEEFRSGPVKATLAGAVDCYTAPFRAMIFDVLARFDEEYRNRKSAIGKVDFNDLERYAIALLRDNPAVRENIRKQFRQVMLDEFQDVNGQQAALMALLRAENVFFGVGDGNQSIYGFRHARPEIFAAYQTEVAEREAHSVSLLHNFRSRESILRCVRAMMSGKDGIDDRELVAGANFAGKEEPSIEVLKIGDSGDDKEAACDREAAWIAHRIRAMTGALQLGRPGATRLADFRDFAVLCRSGDSMTPILAAFDRAGIPYVCGRRQSFLLSRAGLDITALLSLIANPRDSISLAGLLRSPLVGVSDEGLLRLRLLAGSLTSGFNRFGHSGLVHGGSGLTESDASKLERFSRNLNRWRRDQPVVPLDLLLSRALADCGFNWAPAVSGPGADIESFLCLARTTGAAMDLPAFLREIESLSKAAEAESDLSDEDRGNCVQVMTAHAAKGLEFNVTIVAAMDKGPRRESGPVTFTTEYGVGIKWRNPTAESGKNELKDSWAEANKTLASEKEKDEENRLLYVAMTRAAEHLILSYSHGKQRPSNWARIVDDYFGLREATPSPEMQQEERDGFSTSILTTDSDPPRTAYAKDRRGDLDVEVTPRPAAEDRHETAVTVTSLAVFASCPRRYYIERSLGWNGGRFRRFDPEDLAGDDIPDEEVDLTASSIGSAVHEILAGLPPSVDSEEARQLASAFSRSDLGRRAAASERAAREWAFIVEIDGMIVRGSIDLWFEEKGRLYVVDYKTDNVAPAGVPAHTAYYKPQVTLYAIALERALGIRPEALWLHFLRPDIVVKIEPDDSAIASVRSLISELQKAQNELRFDLNEGEHCRSCRFYKSTCPAGKSRRPGEDGILEAVEPDDHSTGN